ncbi:hypothetical protein HAZT_HAZT010469 [Hyalella azteca]|uniref:Protein stoned-A-like n=1 Tax=Hyalella azteca TaxID=294128 RepID=A0A6A0HDQ6_HYAAZ|nr:protein stoned-A-like [Hyalella azteca]KAA0202787.1 hypothetical protein HAZT_HAZT010469 [Hyalella azteca]
MHKIKKGIKKKIKGKKGKHDDDEIFTEEELAQYKREKAEEARRLAEEEQQHHDTEVLEEDDVYETDHYPRSNLESRTSPKEGEEKDWKSFLATTDTVLKQTSDNLEHIKESSYFQTKKGLESDGGRPVPDFVESYSQKASACTSPVPATASKNWVDLEKEGIDDESDEGQTQATVVNDRPPSPPKKKLLELKPIEDLPEVSAEDYADVFDTTYVDQVESGELKLIIPDSPSDEYSNEPDPFDTSAVDKVLHINEPEPEPEPQVIAGTKKGEPQKKRKIQLVSLGNAVEVLTGKTPIKTKTDDANEISLLGDFDEVDVKSESKVEKDKKVNAEEESKSEEGKQEEEADTVESNVINDILFGSDDLSEELPEVGVPDLFLIDQCRKKSEADAIKNQATASSPDLCENADSSEEQISTKALAVNDIISEFDVIDNVDVTDESLIPKCSESEILDEFDAEFVSLAHESIAKAKEKEIDELGLDDDEDPFDTSYVSHEVLDKKEVNEFQADDDPFDVKLDNNILKSSQSEKPARPAPPSQGSQNPDLFSDEDPLTNDEVDPFDTSIVHKVLPIDHLETTENDADLASTLQPHSGGTITKSESFDPFDTSAADAFGVTELKVLESELLSGPNNPIPLTRGESDDFDFNPREGEESTKPDSPKDFFTSEVDTNDSAVLEPQAKSLEIEELDPFDTSFADKIQIKSLEEELLEKREINEEIYQDTLQVKAQPPPRPPSPACLLVTSPVDEDIAPALQPLARNDSKNNLVGDLENDIDPFDTSIADSYGITELKVLESELLAETEDTTPVPISTASENDILTSALENNSLSLDVKPARPQTPECLLAATPIDENPTLVPQYQPSQIEAEDDFDPFDTSIAQQFGKTELHALESQLLSSPAVPLTDADDFDPRAVTPEHHTLDRSDQPTSHLQTCLLSSDTDNDNPVDLPIAPSLPKTTSEEKEFDPFDTSIADKLGTTELKHLENELLSQSQADEFDSSSGTIQNIPQDLNLKSKPERPLQPPQQCLLATTPTDCSQSLQPQTSNLNLSADAEQEDFDPFDTSIANQFGKTEIKELETTLLAEKNEPSAPVYNSVVLKTLNRSHGFGENNTSLADTDDTENFDDFDPRSGENRTAPKHTLSLLDSVEDTGLSDESLQVLQPLELRADEIEDNEDIDPFDTTIAACILPGKAELKILESELLN